MPKPVTLNLRKPGAGLLLTATIIETPEYRLRLWLGRALLRLGCWVMGCAVVFDWDVHE